MEHHLQFAYAQCMMYREFLFTRNTKQPRNDPSDPWLEDGRNEIPYIRKPFWPFVILIGLVWD